MIPTLSATALIALALVATVPAKAAPVTFTWNPSLAAPSLTGGSAFTADAINVTNFIRTTNVNNPTTLRQTFSGDQLQTINGFTLNGVSVVVPGLNSTFGLYFRISPAGSFPINAAGVTIGPATYTQLDISLVADVGRDDGTVSVSAAGLGFSTPAGLANDVVLATGTLLSAGLSADPDGTRHARYLTTFQPVPGEAAFFAAPLMPLEWEEFLTTPAAALSSVRVDNLTVLSIADGNRGSVGVAQLVPEPGSMALLGTGLLALHRLRRRNAC